MQIRVLKRPEREKCQNITDVNNSKVTGWTNAAFVFTAWCWSILRLLATSWILRCCQEKTNKHRTTQNKLTDTQTKPILAFSFLGTGMSVVKIPVAWVTSAITATGSWRASPATVFLSFRCCDSPGPVSLENRQGPFACTASNASYTLDLFYKLLMYIHLNLGSLKACRSWLKISVSRVKL